MDICLPTSMTALEAAFKLAVRTDWEDPSIAMGGSHSGRS